MKREEVNFVLNVLEEREVKNADNLDWYTILGFLELNKISGYFYQAAKKLGVSLPQAVERKLSQILSVQTARNLIMRRYIQDISDALRFEKLKYAFLKGSVLSNANFNLSELSLHCFQHTPEELKRHETEQRNTFYGDGARISNDIDILIQQKDITTVTRLLKEMGFVQGWYDFKNQEVVALSRQEILSRRMNRGETAPFLLKIDSEILPVIEVDVNFSLDFLPNSNEELLEKLLNDTIDYSGTIKGGIRSLAVGDFFLHLLMHQYKESILYSMVERNKDLELYKLLDIYLFIKLGYIDFMGLYQSVRKYRLEKEVYYVLKTVSEVFTDIPLCGFVEMIDPQDLSYLREVIDPQQKKKYRWEGALWERLPEFDKKPFLREVTDD